MKTTMPWLGIGAACSRSGDDGGKEEGLGVDNEGCEGHSERSRGKAEPWGEQEGRMRKEDNGVFEVARTLVCGEAQ